jgi:hypothetical protein
MCYLFREGLETGDVLRVGQDTVSVEYHGDGPQWRILDDGTSDPIYPWFALRQISELTNEDIERIGEQIKVHLKERRTLIQRKRNELIAKGQTLSDELDEVMQREKHGV